LTTSKEIPDISNKRNEETSDITSDIDTNNKLDDAKQDVSCVSPVSQEPKVDRKEDSQIPEPLIKEDYEVYIARQTKKVRAIEARRIFDELALKNVEENPGMKEVLEPKFREILASTGFSDGDIDVIIKDMEKDGLERISTQLDGAICDILKGDK
jgi:hypothetical protein